MIFKLKHLFEDHEDIPYLSKLKGKILNQRNRTKQTTRSDYFNPYPVLGSNLTQNKFLIQINQQPC